VHILVVEDEVRLARQIASALTEAGHDPIAVHDGEATLHIALETPFDLIVLDLGLPRIDGFEVLRRLRAHNM
jgi:two-component system copper resistance phosphate regulon response regulator CusR